MIAKPIAQALVLAAVFLGVAFALRYAGAAGWISEDLSRRIVQVIIGLGLAAYGNLMPKQGGKPRGSAPAETATQAALRVGGWSMALAGLVYAALWAFAPLAFADYASLFVILGATALTLVFAIRAGVTCGVRTADQ